MPPYDDSNDQAQPGLNIPPPPQPTQSLPALLSGIGGTILNILGATSRSGPAGEGAVSLSDKLQQEQNSRMQQQYGRQVYEIKREQQRNVGQALQQRLGEVDNPAAKTEIQTAINNDMLPFAQQRFSNEMLQQRWEARQDKSDQRLQNQDDLRMSQGLGDFVREHLTQAKQVQSQLPPQVQQALGDQAFFSSRKQPFSSPDELREAYNQRPDVKKKIGDKDAQALWNNYSAAINSQRAPALGSDFLGKTLGFGQAPDPSQAFKDYATRTLDPAVIQAYQQGQGEIQSHYQAVQQAHTLRQQLLNPKTRAQAREAISSFIGGGAGQQDQPVGPASTGSGVPPVGALMDGHRFLGGDPSQQSSWKKVN